MKFPKTGDTRRPISKNVLLKRTVFEKTVHFFFELECLKHTLESSQCQGGPMQLPNRLCSDPGAPHHARILDFVVEATGAWDPGSRKYGLSQHNGYIGAVGHLMKLSMR